jgi:pyruvate dehydrogenase E1 component alpha subunit
LVPATGKVKAKRGGSSAEALLRFYEQLLLVRRCEERLMTLFADGEVAGFIHLSIGQEAVSVGVMSALTGKDTIASTHRGHGHAIAKGIPLEGFFAELLGRDNGVCRGRGGSMHVADMSAGMLGANGIVGAGIPIALGSALAHHAQETGRIAVSFFGDGALAEGVLHESVNIAALWKLPILFVCEANGWSEFSPSARQIGFDLESWSRSFALIYRKVDGNDVLAVAEAAQSLVTALRKGSGPALLECVTSRVRGHYEGDAQKYRPADEGAGRDPLDVAREHLAGAGVTAERLSQVAAEIDERIETAIAVARSGPSPTFESALADVYTTGPA